MATYYVGIGGNNGNSGLTWALRKLTLNGAEDVPVVAGDTVIVGPGTYREQLTTDVSGTAGNPITYVGDESGILTDGVGGEIRVTGSNDDQTVTRSFGVTSTGHNYRTFRGIHFDTVGTAGINATGSNFVVEQCAFMSSSIGITASGTAALNYTIRRCLFLFISGTGVNSTHTVTVDNVGHLIENCVFLMPAGRGIDFTRTGGCTVRNCLFSAGTGVRQITAPAAGQTNTINNCIITGCGSGLVATATTDLTENYNALFGNSTARTNVTAGANSVAYTPLLLLPLLTMGLHTWRFPSLASASALAAIAGTGVASDDFFGTTRAATSSWGAVQQETTRRPNDAGYPRSRILQ